MLCFLVLGAFTLLPWPLMKSVCAVGDFCDLLAARHIWMRSVSYELCPSVVRVVLIPDVTFDLCGLNTGRD